MANQLTEGVVQVFSLDVASLNYALRDLTERLDALKGLRGRSLIWDRTQVSTPSADTDAVDLQSLITQESRFRADWISPPGILASPGSVTYVELSSGLRQPVDLANLTSPRARMIVAGWGTESGAGKGVALHDGTSVIAEVTWDGHTEATRAGAFMAVTLTADTTLQLRAKGTTTTEQLILKTVLIEWKVAINVLSL